MIVSDIRYEILIIATKGDPNSWIIEVNRPGMQAIHYAVGPNASIANNIFRIIEKIEFENEKQND